MTDQNYPSATVLDAIIPTNPLVAFSCWIGIASVVVCVVWGWCWVRPPFFWHVIDEEMENAGIRLRAKASKLRTWIGIGTGGLGTVIGIVMLIVIFNNH